jgi:hypothetical protein
MDKRFPTGRTHNKRLINVLACHVAQKTMCEHTALRIAKDSWKTITGVFTEEDNQVLKIMWDKYFHKYLEYELN